MNGDLIENVSRNSANRGPIAGFLSKVKALWQLAWDPKASPGARAIAFMALVYLVIPGPVPGPIDEILVLIIVITAMASTLNRYLNKEVHS